MVPGRAGHVCGPADPAGIGLEPGCQGISHPGDQEADRRLGDQRGIDDHHVRIARQDKIPLERALVGVDDGQRATGGVGRRDGRHNDDRELAFEGDGLCGVERLAAAHADDGIATLRFRTFDDPVDLALGALSAKGFDDGSGGTGKTGVDTAVQDLADIRVLQHERPRAQPFTFLAKHRESMRALDVSAGKDRRC